MDCYSHRIDCSTGSTILGLGYDAQGNLANWNGKLHNFDYGNRLRSVTDVESYRYDAHGRRIRAWTPSAGLLYSLYSQAGQLLWQHDSRTSKRREYVYLNGSLVAERTRPIGSTAETITYQHTDALGTPVLKTSASRVILERREYEPYGKLLNQPLASGPGFTGHDTDPDTQYTYMQQRYYDPRVGRFWSVDPVTAYSNGDARYFNRYWYAVGNPYKFRDADGRAVETVWDAINVGLGVANFIDNARAGNWGAAAVDGLGVVVDSAAAAVPFVPGGASTAIRTYRTANAAMNGASALQTASRAASKAAKTASEFKVSAKHLPGAGGNFAKFAEGVNIGDAIKTALTSDAAKLLPNGDKINSFVVIADMGTQVGSKGETSLKVVVGNDGKIWTAYPTKAK